MHSCTASDYFLRTFLKIPEQTLIHWFLKGIKVLNIFSALSINIFRVLRTVKVLSNTFEKYIRIIEWLIHKRLLYVTSFNFAERHTAIRPIYSHFTAVKTEALGGEMTPRGSSTWEEQGQEAGLGRCLLGCFLALGASPQLSAAVDGSPVQPDTAGHCCLLKEKLCELCSVREGGLGLQRSGLGAEPWERGTEELRKRTPGTGGGMSAGVKSRNLMLFSTPHSCPCAEISLQESCSSTFARHWQRMCSVTGNRGNNGNLIFR